MKVRNSNARKVVERILSGVSIRDALSETSYWTDTPGYDTWKQASPEYLDKPDYDVRKVITSLDVSINFDKGALKDYSVEDFIGDLVHIFPVTDQTRSLSVDDINFEEEPDGDDVYVTGIFPELRFEDEISCYVDDDGSFIDYVDATPWDIVDSRKKDLKALESKAKSKGISMHYDFGIEDVL